MHKLDKVGILLGITTREVFNRAHKAYGGSRDSPTSAYNLYTATDVVPNFVAKFLISELEKNSQRRRR